MFELKNSYSTWLVISVALKILLTCYFLLRRFRAYILSLRTPGPVAFPIFGNLPQLAFKRGALPVRFNKIVANYRNDFRFWFGRKLLFIAQNEESIDKIMNSTETQKLDEFSVLKPHLTCKNDTSWRLHKKLIKPLINVKFIIDNIDAFQENVNLLVDKLSKHLDRSPFDITSYMRRCYVDIFGEIILGEKIKAQTGKNVTFLNANETCAKLEAKQLWYSWLSLTMFFKFTSSYTDYKKARETQKYFVENIIRKSWERRKLDMFGENRIRNVARAPPLVDKIADFIESNPGVISNEEFRDYLLSFFSMGENAMSTITSFACVCFALHPEEQKKVRTEIESVLGEKFKSLKYEDLYRLKYLDMCLLETIRLVSFKGFLLKNFEDTLQLGKLKIPSECTIVIPNYALNRNKEYEFPDKFHPEHFTAEKIKNRKFPNLNFGFGCQDCIGKQLSMIGMKIMLINVLTRFEILETEGSLSDHEASLQSLHSLQHFNVKLKQRV